MTHTKRLMILFGHVTVLAAFACGSEEGSSKDETNQAGRASGGTTESSAGGGANLVGGADASGGDDAVGGADASGGGDAGAGVVPASGGTEASNTGGSSAEETGGVAGTGESPESGGAESTGGGSGGSTLSPNPVINELMPSNHETVADENGGFADWIELYNGATTDLDIGGWYISDDMDDPLKAELASGLVVPAGGVLLLWADDDTEQGALHVPFKLSATSEVVVLSQPDGTPVDSIEYDGAEGDVSFARLPDGTGEFAWCTSATPDATNGDSC